MRNGRQLRSRAAALAAVALCGAACSDTGSQEAARRPLSDDEVIEQFVEIWKRELDGYLKRVR